MINQTIKKKFNNNIKYMKYWELLIKLLSEKEIGIKLFPPYNFNHYYSIIKDTNNITMTFYMLEINLYFLKDEKVFFKQKQCSKKNHLISFTYEPKFSGNLTYTNRYVFFGNLYAGLDCFNFYSHYNAHLNHKFKYIIYNDFNIILTENNNKYKNLDTRINLIDKININKSMFNIEEFCLKNL
jgi:hypothetical protein